MRMGRFERYRGYLISLRTAHCPAGWMADMEIFGETPGTRTRAATGPLPSRQAAEEEGMQKARDHVDRLFGPIEPAASAAG